MLKGKMIHDTVITVEVNFAVPTEVLIAQYESEIAVTTAHVKPEVPEWVEGNYTDFSDYEANW